MIRACKEMGIKTVAIFSEADEDCLHTTMADESVCVGPANAASSYLNIANILSAAEVYGCDAIHPGYGFLSESERFASLCKECNITFIGPSLEMIQKMGNKDEARKSVKEAGVVVVPGSAGIVETYEIALKEAIRLGFPVLIKAAAGGGGKGMRIIYQEKEMKEAFELARSEALSAFGSPDVYIEKYITPVRHIEIQVLGDKKGNIVCFPERDCSLQRRNQKLIEETPSPFIWQRLRKKLMNAAYKAAHSCRYESAGTVEFIVNEKGDFYFLEMNTRIQVEHPVTEILTGVDIVKEQIKVAASQELDIETSDFYEPEGCAMEFRINAEDYKKDFMPSPGEIKFCFFPGGPGVRVDTHIYSGYTVPRNYDSLLAKIIVYEKDRDGLLKRARRVLEEIRIEGVPTTKDFYLKILDYHELAQGKITTDSITRIFEWLEEKKL
ncbi:MAG: acetyl-CoA carboxylase biotin carboxylase subunit [Candidatus Hydrogenedentota bacterium]